MIPKITLRLWGYFSAGTGEALPDSGDYWHNDAYHDDGDCVSVYVFGDNLVMQDCAYKFPFVSEIH